MQCHEFLAKGAPSTRLNARIILTFASATEDGRPAFVFPACATQLQHGDEGLWPERWLRRVMVKIIPGNQPGTEIPISSEKSRPGATPCGFLIRLPVPARFRRMQ